MRLKSFRVRKFRNVLDSGWVDVDEAVTALVGKNESGKTTLLEALYRFNPAHEASFDVIDHYPRWIEIPDRKAGVIESTTPIEVKFELDRGDVSVVESALGEGVLTGPELTVALSYEGRWTVTIPCDPQKAILDVFDRIGLSATNRKRFGKAKDLKDLKDAVVNWRSQVDEAPEAGIPQALIDIEKEVGDMGDEAWRVAWGVLKPRLPKFFYFSDYSQLPGRVDLRELADEASQPGGDGFQTARALLLLAGTDTDALSDETYELRKAELEAVSNELTRQVFEYWTQNPDLSVEMDVDKETIDTPNGQRAVARFLETRVKDRRHGYTNNFDQRSAGFQWFFSFLAAFSEFEGSENPVVVLLDEPALSLHGKAQADYLRFIDERLAKEHQVLYSTHSPFMVEPGKLHRVRIVEDRGPEEGAVVSDSVLARDPDSVFPLQAALGYDIAKSLFVGGDNLVVEGTSDFAYLTLVSDRLKQSGKPGIDERWTISPVGGAQNIPTFVALLGSHLDVTVLIDSSSKSSAVQRLNDMVASGLLEGSRLVPVGDALDTRNADIEDLFAVEDYLGLYNSAFDENLKESDLPEGERIVKRIAEHRGADFDHGRPAEVLLRERDKVLDGFSEVTYERFGNLIERLNATLA
ncbi:MAG: AAA family ATPase [Solirubrobacterales bacterium]|nr:AAA family ATPase [Solirubrobacterales bacterium]